MIARVSSFPRGESAKVEAAGDMESGKKKKSRGKQEKARHKSWQVVSRVSLATIQEELWEAMDKQTNDFKKAEKGTSLGHTTTYFVRRL